MIDWFTVVAQIINFLILVWLLKRFLYSRIIEAMEQREAKLRKQLEDIETEKKNLEKEIAVYEEKNQKFTEERKQKIKEMEDEIGKEKSKLILQVQKETEEHKEKWRKAIAEEEKTFVQQLRRYIGEETVNISQRILKDVASTTLESSIVECFVEKLKQLDDKSCQQLLNGYEVSKRVLIVSSFDLVEEAQQKIARALEQRLGENLNVDFSVSPEIICGLTLKLEGYKIAWNIQDHLYEFEERIKKSLQQEIALSG